MFGCFNIPGEGDTGDVWVVVCDGDFWGRDEAVMFKHVDTGESCCYVLMTLRARSLLVKEMQKEKKPNWFKNLRKSEIIGKVKGGRSLKFESILFSLGQQL